MKRQFKMAGITALALIGLVGCSEEVAEKEVSKVESVDKAAEAEAQAAKEAEEKAAADKAKTPKQEPKLIADDAIAKITLKSIEYVSNPEYEEEYYEVIFEVVNKTGKSVEVQSEEVSLDGVMVDDFVSMSETIAAGKTGNVDMRIENYGGELPAFKENFEGTLKVMDGDTYEDMSTQKVNVDFK